ncbi:MAG: thermonuclease family protein [Halobaculum sp.]
MERRTLLRGIAAGGLLSTGAGTAAGEVGGRPRASTDATAETIQKLYFDSTSSLLTADGKPLTSDDHVAVRARATAKVTDQDGGGDATKYGDTKPALVGVDGTVVGFGTMLVTNDTDFALGNDEFVLNVWDEIAGDGLILWDEGHDQYYTADKFTTFTDTASENGFTVEATTDFTSRLSEASGIVITSPTKALSDGELSALADFAADGGAVFLHDQSDYKNFDATDNVNAIASELGLAFRFNDDQVIDNKHNNGAFFQPTTNQFNTDFPFFATREGVPDGPKFSFDEEYTATITEVDDGDTFGVEFADGATEEVRVLGVDTPEVPEAADAENPYEWEGLGDQASMPEDDGDYPYLSSQGEVASKFAKEELAGKTVTLTFDENEGIEDPFGRILAYAYYDADGSGSRDTLWAQRLLQAGHARVYDSGLAKHDELIQTEAAARRDGRGLWAESDPKKSPTIRNDPVEQLFFPNPVPVSQFGGDLPAEQVPVTASESASESGAPLVGVDRENRVAVVGAPMVADDYEDDSFAGDASVSAYGNMPFVTNLLDALSDHEGDVLWDGGHGQFGSEVGISVEGAAFYQRYLEGVDLGLEQVNGYGGQLLSGGRALLVTPPTQAFTDEQISAIRSFRDDGGAVILFGSATNTDATSRLNGLAASLGSDLTFEPTGITDPESNLGGNEALVATDRLDDQFGLFGSFTAGEASLPDTATPTASPTESPTADEPATASATATATATTANSPGFGALTGAASVLGGGLYALENTLAGDEAGDD